MSMRRIFPTTGLLITCVPTGTQASGWYLKLSKMVTVSSPSDPKMRVSPTPFVADLKRRVREPAPVRVPGGPGGGGQGRMYTADNPGFGEDWTPSARGLGR